MNNKINSPQLHSTGILLQISRQRAASMNETNSSLIDTNPILSDSLQHRFSTLIGTRFALILIVIFSVLLVIYYYTVTSFYINSDNNIFAIYAKRTKIITDANNNMNNIYIGNTDIYQPPIAWLRKPVITSDIVHRHINIQYNTNQSQIHVGAPHIDAQLCSNTKQGIVLVTDSTGAICTHDMILNNGCCSESIHKHTELLCQTCDSELQCCIEYEYCVACCMQQSTNTLQQSIQYELSDALPDELKKQLYDTDTITNTIKYNSCTHLCRTSSRSTIHGNLYRNKYKHCYNEKHNDIQIELDMATIITAPQGISCTAACQQLQVNVRHLNDSSMSLVSGEFVCWELLLHEINTCDYLTQHYSCENGCVSDSGSDLPCYVGTLSDDHKHRGMCLTNNQQQLFHCDGYNEHTHRLCSCVSKDYAQQYQ